MLRRFMTRHPVIWRGIDEKKRDKWAQQLEDAGDEAHAQMTSSPDNGERREAAKVLVSVVRTGTLITRIQQIERLKREEWDRLDAGKVTKRTEHTGSLTIGHLIAANPDAIDAIEAAAVEANRRLEAPTGEQGGT